jgi:hypothetical protein
MRLPLLMFAAATITACGPDLNSPSSNSITGKWQSADSISYFYNLKMDLSQTTAGDLTGSWSGLLTGGHLSCPENAICPASNTITGRNTVVGVTIEILGVGTFTGQLENGNTLRGDILRFDGDFKTKFTKVP